MTELVSPTSPASPTGDAHIEIPEPVAEKKVFRVHPVGVCILNLLTFGALGYALIGQRAKARAAVIYTIFLSLLLVGLFTPILAAVDGYLVGKKAYDGEPIDSKHCALRFLKKLPLWTDMEE